MPLFLQVVYACRKEAWFGYHGYTQWGHALMAMDVAYDVHMNAYILDVNSGPSFYHILVRQEKYAGRKKCEICWAPTCGGSVAKEWISRAEEWISRLQEWISRSEEWILRSGEWISRSEEWISRLQKWISRSEEGILRSDSISKLKNGSRDQNNDLEIGHIASKDYCSLFVSS